MLDQYDLLAIFGVALLACGIYMAYGAAAMTVMIGVVALIVAVVGAWKKSGKGKKGG